MARSSSGASAPIPRTNIVVLRGTLAAAPAPRDTPTGVVTDATIRVHTVAEGVAVREQVPLVWLGAPDRFGGAAAEATVVVVGRVRQRFFRSGASTVSRTEVVVEELSPISRRVGARRTLDGASLAVSLLGGE